MIVITTPTGDIGNKVLTNTLDSGEPVRVIVRDPSRLSAEVRDRVEAVPGSHGDAAVLDRAFAGADAVFWLGELDTDQLPPVVRRGPQTRRRQARPRPADRPRRCFATRKGLPRTFRHPCKVGISTPFPTDRDSFTN